MKLKLLFLIGSIFTLVSTLKTDHLFFDLNGVLLRTSKLKAFKQLGLEVVRYPDIKKRLFDFMNYIDEKNEDESKFSFQGDKMPSFLCKWQKGGSTCKEVTEFIIEQADKNTVFFKSETEKKLIKKSAEFFLPQNNIKITRPIPSTINLIKKCKAKKDKNGKKLHTVYLTSNFDEETFDLVKKEFPNIVNLFDKDKIIISGAIKKIKPDGKFFDHIVKKFNLKRKECCLIDDTPENITGAKNYGINAIHYRSTVQVERDLKKAKIL